MTTVYGNDDDDEEKNINNVFVKIEEEDMGLTGMTDVNKNELKELKKNTVELCYSILDMISNNDMNISRDHIQELADLIDDTLLWLHIHNKISKSEYINKINEIHTNCNVICDYYKEHNMPIFKENILSTCRTKRNELENLCIILQLKIEDGEFLEDTHCLYETIEENLKWIYENDDILNTTINEKTYDTYCKNCETRCEEINKLHNNLHIKQGPCENTNNITDLDTPNKTEFDDDNDESGGTSIIDLIQKNNINIVKNLIEKL